MGVAVAAAVGVATGVDVGVGRGESNGVGVAVGAVAAGDWTTAAAVGAGLGAIVGSPSDPHAIGSKIVAARMTTTKDSILIRVSPVILNPLFYLDVAVTASDHNMDARALLRASSMKKKGAPTRAVMMPTLTSAGEMTSRASVSAASRNTALPRALSGTSTR